MTRMAILLLIFFGAQIKAETWVSINNKPLRLKDNTSCTRAVGKGQQQQICDCCLVRNADVRRYKAAEALEQCAISHQCKYDEALKIDENYGRKAVVLARSRLESMTIANVDKLTLAPEIAADGVLTDDNVVDILHVLTRHGLLNLPAQLFDQSSFTRLFAKPLGESVKGVYSGQLFFVGYKVHKNGQTEAEHKTEPLYILKETKKGISEISHLYEVGISPLKGERVNTYQKHFGVVEKTSSTIAQVAFDDLHFKLKTNGLTRYFSLLQTAPGKSLNKHLRDFGKIAQTYETDDAEFQKALVKMKHIFYRVGFSMSELHQKYAQESYRRAKPLKRTFVHGDLHSENLFYDEQSDVVTLIDNETFALSLKKPSLGINDIVEFYTLHTVKTIAHTVASQLTNNQEFGINDALWHELWRSLFEGYLAAYGKLSAEEFEVLFADFKSKFYKGLSQTRIFRNPRNFADQRKLKRFGPSLRRRKILHDDLAETFNRLHLKKINQFEAKAKANNI